MMRTLLATLLLLPGLAAGADMAPDAADAKVGAAQLATAPSAAVRKNSRREREAEVGGGVMIDESR